jgi:hypothetical protein
MDDKATINFGLRTPHLKRDVTNNLSEGNTYGTYRIQKTYSDGPAAAGRPLPHHQRRPDLRVDRQEHESAAELRVSVTRHQRQIINGVASPEG